MKIVPTKKSFKYFKTKDGYNITYTSPVTGKSWTRTIKDENLINKTLLNKKPKSYHIEDLIRTIKF